MKKLVAIMLVVFALLVLAVTPVLAQGDAPADVTDPVQLYIIGVVASAIVYGIGQLRTRFPNFKVHREWLTVFLYIVAFALSLYWGGLVAPAFPAFSDPVSFVAAVVGFVNELLIALAVPISFATLIYNLLLKRVLDALGERVGWIEPSKKAVKK